MFWLEEEGFRISDLEFRIWESGRRKSEVRHQKKSDLRLPKSDIKNSILQYDKSGFMTVFPIRHIIKRVKVSARLLHFSAARVAVK
jgi:hypothetical protein